MKKLLIVAALGIALTGCATKRYGRMQSVTGFEKSQYTCRDIELEIAKVESFQQQIAEGAEFNAASALGILGDFGIGNSMEKGSAQKSAVQRLGQLKDLKAEKGCYGPQVASAETKAVETVTDTPVAETTGGEP